MSKARTGSKMNGRLYVVGGLFVVATVVLWVRLVQVQVFSRGHYSSVARSQWKVSREVPAVRGAIFDREGRPLALSIRSCSVGVRTRDVKDARRVASVLAKHLPLSSREIRKRIRSGGNYVWVQRKCELDEEAREAIAKLAGVDVIWEADRVYPFGAVAAKLVGFVGHDGRGMAGVEAAFDEDLNGVAGWEEVQRDGRYRLQGYGTYARRNPIDGKHIVLTIDAFLQEQAEYELKKAVRKTGAAGGVVIIMDCRNGDILALAEYPAAEGRTSQWRADSLWTVQSVSCMYEPGSTFKLITAAALLETNSVRSFDVFDAEDGRANLGPAVIEDAHPHGHLTFREAFVHSSNIVMAKASTKLEAKKFFEYIRLFGFGSETGIRLLGESGGSVAPVKEWSDRTQITMAFGQEIGVTPLQMVNAYAAVANDGVLMVPRIVSSVIDGGDVERFEPVRVRRVIGRDTARQLREFCRGVVEEGTGTSAALSFLPVAGKTGTAEKASAAGGYMHNRFVASFAGFAPTEEPCVVSLVTLDEPKWAYRFGGVSAAPVFARLSEVIANSSHLLDGAVTYEAVPASLLNAGAFRAPNFLRQSRAQAMERARALELNVLCSGNGDEVVAQDPDPGVAMNRDEVVRLYLGSPASDGSVTAPDVRGLSIRLAKRRAVEAGFRCEIVGSGVVHKQRPGPGGRSKAKVLTLYCRDDLRNG